MGMGFFQQTKFLKTNEFFLEIRCRSEEKKLWVNEMDRSEKWKKYRFLKTNDKKTDLTSFKRTWKNNNFFAELTNFQKDFDKTIVFFLNEPFFCQTFEKMIAFYWKCNFLTNFWKNNRFLTERMLLLNELFHWTNDFTKRMILMNNRSVRKRRK